MATKPCASADCENTVSERMDSGFCFTCLGVLQRESAEMFVDLDKVLRLEAEFQRYCREHNLPDPHEK